MPWSSASASLPGRSVRGAAIDRARVREDLALRTRALLLARAAGESDRVLRPVRSQLDLSLSRVA